MVGLRKIHFNPSVLVLDCSLVIVFTGFYNKVDANVVSRAADALPLLQKNVVVVIHRLEQADRVAVYEKEHLVRPDIRLQMSAHKFRRQLSCASKQKHNYTFTCQTTHWSDHTACMHARRRTAGNARREDAGEFRKEGLVGFVVVTRALHHAVDVRQNCVKGLAQILELTQGNVEHHRQLLQDVDGDLQ